MDLEIIYVPILEDSDYSPDLKKFRSAINKNTVMLIASAPQYPQGLMDPIEEIGKIGKAIYFFIQKLSRTLKDFCCHLFFVFVFYKYVFVTFLTISYLLTKITSSRWQMNTCRILEQFFKF